MKEELFNNILLSIPMINKIGLKQSYYYQILMDYYLTENGIKENFKELIYTNFNIDISEQNEIINELLLQNIFFYDKEILQIDYYKVCIILGIENDS